MSQPLEYQIKVSLADHKVTLLHNGVVEFEAPAAIGTDENPTPTGTFYYTDPLDLAHASPAPRYGVFAIGLSGHSNTLSEFTGGDGQIAIHGTNDPGTIGDGGLARLRAGEQRRDPEARAAAARHARRHQLARRTGAQPIVSVADSVASTVVSAHSDTLSHSPAATARPSRTAAAGAERRRRAAGPEPATGNSGDDRLNVRHLHQVVDSAPPSRAPHTAPLHRYSCGSNPSGSEKGSLSGSTSTVASTPNSAASPS